MADNVTIPATGSGTATPVIATDDISSVHYQRVKVTFGSDGAASDVSSSNGLPVLNLANSGVDIGDVTINNASGGSAVNIQDGGNSITIDHLSEGANAASIQTRGVLIGGYDGSNFRFLSTTSAGIVNSNDNQVIADNGGFTDGTSKVWASGFIYDEVVGTTLTENDVAAARIDSKRAQVYVMEDATTRGQRAVVNYQGRQVFAPAADVVTVSGNVALAPFRQPVNTSTTGAILVSGQANRRIRVLNGLLMAPTAVTVQFKSNNNSDCTGPLSVGATGGFQIPEAEIGNFETQVGENLTVVLSSAVVLGGWLTVVYV